MAHQFDHVDTEDLEHEFFTHVCEGMFDRRIRDIAAHFVETFDPRGDEVACAVSVSVHRGDLVTAQRLALEWFYGPSSEAYDEAARIMNAHWESLRAATN